MTHTLVIAELGSCHDGSLEKMKRLILAAKECGADVAKGQYWSSADRLADRRKVPDSYREIYRRYQMPRDWLAYLAGYCESVGIEWMVTTYLPEDVATVAPFVKRFKVSSFEAGDDAFLSAYAPFDKPVMVSCGMRSGDEVWRLSDTCWSLFRDVTLLHCVSSYPAPSSEMGLSVLRRGLDDRMFDGLSDHSRQIDMGALAVAAGAEIIETHLRLDDTDPANPDYAVAFSSAEFAEYVRLIRRAEVIMGSGEKKLQECERAMSAYRVMT